MLCERKIDLFELLVLQVLLYVSSNDLKTLAAPFFLLTMATTDEERSVRGVWAVVDLRQRARVPRAHNRDLSRACGCCHRSPTGLKSDTFSAPFFTSLLLFTS